MGVTKYLYGASVQGIQSFIFQTNKLKEIVGASGLVEEICTNLFEDNFLKKDADGNLIDSELVVSAAGNVKCIFDKEEDCRQAVLEFPKLVMEKAPGITVSQAVVKMEEISFEEAVNTLELRLRAQRNKQSKSLLAGCMAVERSRRTGLPAVAVAKGDFIDEGTKAKIDFVDSKNKAEQKDSVDKNGKPEENYIRSLYKKLYGDQWVDCYSNLDITNMTGQNDWIAVIHADGNGLGNIVAKIGKDQDKLKDFSHNLSEVTKAAAQEACGKVKAVGRDGQLYMRPVVIGGDDLMVVCRADLAIPFVREYLDSFEKKSNAEKTVGRLSACAGIAFVKSSYPFYYAYNLAETLCGIAKKDAKSREMTDANHGEVPSCLMFHKVQSSFVEDYGVIRQKELTPTQCVSFCYGPYYLKGQEGRWTIDCLTEKVEQLADDKNNEVKTHVREWMTLIYEGKDRAQQKTNRVDNLYGEKSAKYNLYKSLAVDSRCVGDEKRYAAYDALALLTINTQNTQNDER